VKYSFRVFFAYIRAVTWDEDRPPSLQGWKDMPRVLRPENYIKPPTRVDVSSSVPARSFRDLSRGWGLLFRLLCRFVHFDRWVDIGIRKINPGVRLIFQFKCIEYRFILQNKRKTTYIIWAYSYIINDNNGSDNILYRSYIKENREFLR